MTDQQYQEIWIDKPGGRVMCALINGNAGWLMYLRYKGDAGFSSRNFDYDGAPSATIDYVLSNGQRDEYPAAWALPIDVVKRALDYFEKEGRPAPFVSWHNNSGDSEEIEFVPL